MKLAHTIQIVALAALAMTQLAQAQPIVEWNRKVEGVALIPDAAGQVNLHAYVSTTASGESTAPLDLSYDVLVSVNGTVVMTEFVPLEATQSAGGVAGGAVPCGGSCPAFQFCFCGGGQFDCECGNFWVGLIFPLSGISVGDEIIVSVQPQSGSLFEPDTSEDTRLVEYLGDPVFWTRTVTSLDIEPVVGGEGTYDIFAEWEPVVNYDGLLNLSAQIQLLIDGVPVATSIPTPSDDITYATCPTGCGSYCAFDPDGLPMGWCEPGGTPSDPYCPCSHDSGYGVFFPNVVAQPGSTVELIPLPIPGALPELPGFPGEPEDQGTGTIPGAAPCPEDLNSDGIVNAADLAILLGSWGPCAGCAGDLNLDGIINAADLAQLLGSWGPCFPM